MKRAIIEKVRRQVGGAVPYALLKTDLTEKDAFEWEGLLIDLYGRRAQGGVLANLTNGGEGASGVAPSAEARRKLSEAGRRRRDTPETIEKRAAKLRGRPMPEHVRRKLIEAKTGKPSEKRIAVKCVNTGEVFESMKAAAEGTGVSITSICTHLLHGRKIRRGLVFEKIAA